MKRSRTTLLAFALLGVVAGCELIVDFDRTKIDGGTIEAGTSDVTGSDVTMMPDTMMMPDAGMDAPKTDGDAMMMMDTSMQDTGIDVGLDTGIDVSVDAPDGD